MISRFPLQSNFPFEPNAAFIASRFRSRNPNTFRSSLQMIPGYTCLLSPEAPVIWYSPKLALPFAIRRIWVSSQVYDICLFSTVSRNQIHPGNPNRCAARLELTASLIPLGTHLVLKNKQISQHLLAIFSLRYLPDSR